MQNRVMINGRVYSKVNKTTAYILWAIGLTGFFGLHRFYMREIGMGILHLLTFGLFFFGWIYDGITLSRKVDEWNYRIDQELKRQQAREGIYNRLAQGDANINIKSYIDL